jgi:hypothetical protein
MTFTAFGRVTADDVRTLPPLAVIKPLDESVNSGSGGTTLQNDNTLLLSLDADTQYMFELWLIVSGAAIGTGDIKIAFTSPTGSVGSFSSEGYSTSSTSPAIGQIRGLSGSAQAFGVNGSSNLSPVKAKGYIITSTTPGALQLQWAQNTSSATNTTVKAGSWLRAWRPPS